MTTAEIPGADPPGEYLPGHVVVAVGWVLAGLGWITGRFLTSLGWLAGRTWLILAFMAEAVVYGFKAGSALKSAPPPAPEPPARLSWQYARPGGTLHAAHLHAVHAVVLLHPHLIRLAAHGIRAALSALLARKPRISVITPTWQRARLLVNRCIPSVAAQTWDGEIEHVIVSDGPDPALDGVPGVVFLPAHVPALNRGIWARLEGTRLATGDLIAYLDDDNAWRPNHLELLAAAITDLDVSFAYSRALCRNERGVQWEVGCPRPVFAQIDTSLIMHRAGLLETATWEPSGRPADWHLVDRWLAAGARWAHVPEITLDYYARSDPAMAAI